jgi:cytochrome c-type biogenesis protein CcmF
LAATGLGSGGKAALVPWLVFNCVSIPGIYNSTGHSLALHIFFNILFTLILYSTFLTRSGILGDTSVHAFVGSGMDLQLILFIAVFFTPAIILYFIRYNQIPHLAKEENTWSILDVYRSLVIFLSAILS